MAFSKWEKMVACKYRLKIKGKVLVVTRDKPHNHASFLLHDFKPNVVKYTH